MASKKNVTIAAKVPIELEIGEMSAQLNKLQQAFTRIDIESALGKRLQKMLDVAVGKMMKLEATSKRAFSSEREVNKLADEMQDYVNIVGEIANGMEKLDFKNLRFTDADLSGIRELEKNITKIRSDLHQTERGIFTQAVEESNELEQSLKRLSIDPTQVGIEAASKALEKGLKAMQTRINNAQRRIEQATAKKGINEQHLADLDVLSKRGQSPVDFSDPKFFTETKKGIRFKSGGAENFANYMKELGINEELVAKIRQASAKNLSSLQEELSKEIVNAQSRMRSAVKTSEDTISDQTIKIGGFEAEQGLYAGGLEQLRAAYQELQNAYSLANSEVESLRERIDLLKQELVESSGAAEKGAVAINDTGKAADSANSKIQGTAEELKNVAEAGERLNSIKTAIQQWFGFHEIVNLVKNTVRNAITHIRELDKAMTEIAVVTEMTQANLWGQIDAYSALAREYGVSTVGVYQVSQLYYQQGLATNEVMELTNETLKMAKVSGLDYADATDYMTVALRGFKLEMSEAANIADVYSHIAAISASDTTELAIAMSKTASGAEAVGASFENTTAMLATMIEITREAPKFIGPPIGNYWIVRDLIDGKGLKPFLLTYYSNINKGKRNELDIVKKKRIA